MSVVNSLQPPSTPGVEQRPYEPSMEEILASIRRIIADDQSLPRGRVLEPAAADSAYVPASEPLSLRGPVEQAPAEPLQASVHTLHPEKGSTSAEAPIVAPPLMPEAPSVTPDLDTPPASGPAYGTIAAPQYASPEGPAAAMPREEPTPAVPEFRADAAPAASDWDDDRDDEPLEQTLHSRDPGGRDRGLGDQGLGDRGLSERDLDDGGPGERGYDDIGHEAAAPLFSATTDHAVTSAFNMLAATRLADNSDELLTMVREMIRPLLKSWLDDNLPSMVERMVRAEIERVARGGR